MFGITISRVTATFFIVVVTILIVVTIEIVAATILVCGRYINETLDLYEVTNHTLPI